MKYKVSVHYQNKGVLDFYKEFEEESELINWLTHTVRHKQFIERDVDRKVIFVNMEFVTGILIDKEMGNAIEERQEQGNNQL